MDTYIVVDPDARTLTVPEAEQVFGVYGDNNAERKYFKCKRYVGNNIDLSTCHIFVNYISAATKIGQIECDMSNSEEDSNIVFSWRITRNVIDKNESTKIFFAVQAKNADGDTVFTTRKAEGLIYESIEGTETVQEEYADVILQLISRMDKVEENIGVEVEKYLKDNPVLVTNSDDPYKNKTIVAFGDSIIAGWGWKEGTGIIQPLKEKYPNATWINNAESGANIAVTSAPEHTPIVTKILAYSGSADAIIFDGGVNDVNNGISVGNISASYDSTYDKTTFCGALESIFQYIMDQYPLSKKLYLIPHAFSKDNSSIDSIYSKAIEICKKWNMPYLDMRSYSQLAMTSTNKTKYTYNQNSKTGDGVHPNETWYRSFYSPVIDQAFRFLGIGFDSKSNTPTTDVKVTGITLSKSELELNVNESETLTFTISPKNATDKTVVWNSNNSNVNVNAGNVTAISEGNSVVTVTTNDGGFTAQCTVTIKKNDTPVIEHDEIESISLDGNCYFDTGIMPDLNTNVETKMYVTSGPYLFGARDSNYKYGLTVTDNFYAVRCALSSSPGTSVFWNDNWVIKQNANVFTFNSNTPVTLPDIDTFTMTSPIYIGNMSNSNSPAGVGLAGKFYYMKIYSSDTLIANIVPVKKKDGTLCLFDKVRNKYITNSGSGALS